MDRLPGQLLDTFWAFGMAMFLLLSCLLFSCQVGVLLAVWLGG